MKYFILLVALFIGMNVSIAQDEPVKASPEKQRLQEKINVQDQKIVLTSKSITLGNDLVFICHGIEVNSEEMDKLDPNHIEKVEVFKNDAEIKERFGKENTNGVISITLKKKYAKKFLRKNKK